MNKPEAFQENKKHTLQQNFSIQLGFLNSGEETRSNFCKQRDNVAVPENQKVKMKKKKRKVIKISRTCQRNRKIV